MKTENQSNDTAAMSVVDSSDWLEFFTEKLRRAETLSPSVCGFEVFLSNGL